MTNQTFDGQLLTNKEQRHATDRKVTEYETDNHLFCFYNFHIDFVQQQNRKCK